ncbi:MAG: hypothetical protein ABJL67_13635 [Sulfitobacter sp.]
MRLDAPPHESPQNQMQKHKLDPLGNRRQEIVFSLQVNGKMA